MFTFNVYHHEDAAILQRLDTILSEIKTMSAELQALNDNLDKLNATVASVVGVLGELKVKLDDAIAAGSLADLRAASERLAAITDSLRVAAVSVDPTPETPVA